MAQTALNPSACAGGIPNTTPPTHANIVNICCIISIVSSFLNAMSHHSPTQCTSGSGLQSNVQWFTLYHFSGPTGPFTPDRGLTGPFTPDSGLTGPFTPVSGLPWPARLPFCSDAAIPRLLGGLSLNKRTV